MIRFIDLGKQIGLDEDWDPQFAFFCTVKDKFETFAGGEQVFDSYEDFYMVDLFPEQRQRYLNLIPDRWRKSETQNKKHGSRTKG